MCDPVSIGVATAAVGAASSGLSFAGANRAADDARHGANLTYASTYNATERRRVQQEAQYSEDTVSNIIEATAARGRIAASASSMGLDQASTTQATNAADFAAGRSQSILDLNAQSAAGDIEQARQGANIERTNRLKANPDQSPLVLALGIAKAGLSGAGAYSSAGGKF